MRYSEPGGASRLRSVRPVRRVAELGAFGVMSHPPICRPNASSAHSHPRMPAIKSSIAVLSPRFESQTARRHELGRAVFVLALKDLRLLRQRDSGSKNQSKSLLSCMDVLELLVAKTVTEFKSSHQSWIFCTAIVTATCRRLTSSAMTPWIERTSRARLVAFALKLEAPGGAALGKADGGAQDTLSREFVHDALRVVVARVVEHGAR